MHQFGLVQHPSLLPSKFKKRQSRGGGGRSLRETVWADVVRIKVGWIDAAAKTCQR